MNIAWSLCGPILKNKLKTNCVECDSNEAIDDNKSQLESPRFQNIANDMTKTEKRYVLSSNQYSGQIMNHSLRGIDSTSDMNETKYIKTCESYSQRTRSSSSGHPSLGPKGAGIYKTVMNSDKQV